jgi:hypothetical protein
METKITATMIGTSVNVSILTDLLADEGLLEQGSFLVSKSFEDKQDAKDFYLKIVEIKKNPTKENLLDLIGDFNPNLKLSKLAESEGITYDLHSDRMYLDGFTTPIPELLVDTIKDYLNEGFDLTSIKNFWSLLMANPDKRVREDLFKFIHTHDFALTDAGYMIVYKTVNYKHKMEKDLAEFVSETYLKIKDSWKEAPSNYVVYKEITTEIVEEEVEIEGDGDYDLEGYDSYDEFVENEGYEPDWIEDEPEYEMQEVEKKSYELKFTKHETLVRKMTAGDEMEYEIVGALDELMDRLNEINTKSVYTDKHTGKMHIVLGEPVRMSRSACDADPKNDCSYGLHVGATKYVENFRYRHNDDEEPVLVCLVNPANVVAVPEYDHSKMRVSEYFPFAKASVVNGKINIIQSKYYENDYISHEKQWLDAQMERLSKEQEVREHSMNAEMDERELDEYRKIIKNRIGTLS